MTPYKDVIRLMCDFIPVLVEIEQSGMYIDIEELDRLQELCENKIRTLEPEINELVREVMGDTPFNLGSPEQLSQILHSFRVIDKEMWARAFGIATGVKKYRRPNLPVWKINGLVELLTVPIYKTKATKCGDCDGRGYKQLYKKDGKPRKNETKCKICSGKGYFLLNTKEVAGFKVPPSSSIYATVGGFSTSHDVFEELLTKRITDNAKKFIENMVAFNQYTHYLTNFVNGIREAVREDGAVHSQIMQTVAATGRLSSQDPNFHNQPRGSTFPVRRCVVSRWHKEGGKITDADYNQLEFAVAAAMSGCDRAIRAVIDKVDSHSLTRDILVAAGQETDRQGAKPHTFKPLYGGLSGTEAERTYYKAFLDEMYPGIKSWHVRLCDMAVNTGRIILPSGRVYDFPDTVRYRSGGVSNSTKIKNYPVQGTATADIVPCAAIELHRTYKKYKFKSLLVNEVHDSVVTDTHPTEIRQVAEVNADVLSKAAEFFKQRFGYEICVPLRVEVKQGDNWLDQKVVI